MDLTTTHHDNYSVIAVSGRLTAIGAPIVRKTVIELIEQGSTQIVVDLGETTFVDSSGLGALIGGLKSARVAGGDLRIAAVPDSVMTILKLTNLDRVLRSHPTADAAFDV